MVLEEGFAPVVDGLSLYRDCARRHSIDVPEFQLLPTLR